MKVALKKLEIQQGKVITQTYIKRKVPVLISILY